MTARLTTALTVAALVLVAAAPATAAKKKGGGKKGGGNVDITKTANLPIPDKAPGGPGALEGVVNSTIDVTKQFKGRRVRDVNVTLQTLGTANKTAPFAGPTEASDLTAILRAPNGAQVTLFLNLVSAFVGPGFAAFPSIGPLTLDDEAPLNIGFFEPHDPQELYAPYQGTAKPQIGIRPSALAIFDNGPVVGTWTLTMADLSNTGTSNLVSWRLNVTTGRPFLQKGGSKGKRK